MGETPQSIAANMAKAQKMDYISDAAGGAVKAFPFAISGFASGAVKLGLGINGTTPGAEALAGAVDGGTAMVLKSVGDKVFADTVKDSQWLAADADKLEPTMQNVLKQREGLGESMKLAPLGGLGFTARNLVTSTAAVASKNNPAVISNLNNVLSLGAGAAGNVLTNAASSTRGPEFLFGRTDWKERYTALNNTSVSHQMVSGGVDRAKTLVGSVLTPKNYAKGALNIASGNMVSEIGTLAAGIAGTNTVRNIVRNPPAHGPLSTASSATIDAITGRLSAAQLTARGDIAKDAYLNVGLSGVAYAAQGVAGALAGPAPTRNDEWVDKKASELANSKLGQSVGKVVDNTIGRVATSSRQWQAEQRRSHIERGTDNIEMQPQSNTPTEG
ncbi:hypothetical protein AAGR22_04615 [Erwinia sp. HDF1-3R]|uniref:hypothetical protein n=1 Tax=Erwinia sp. HDF1-3R TaxID=3141543 RepID=UPI0031F56C1A